MLTTARMIEDAIHGDTLGPGLMDRFQAMQLNGEKLIDEHRNGVAEVLFSCGISLIPSDHLLDHQFVVSRGVYDAARKMSVTGGQ